MKPSSTIRFSRGIGILAVSLILAACQPANIVRNSVLNESPCNAPCWYNINIGAALSVDEIVKVLNDLPNMGTIWQPTPGDISWHWNSAKNNGPNSIFLKDGKVESVRLYFDSDVSVAEIVEHFGEPVSVSLGQALLPEEPFAVLCLYYPTKGTIFVVEVSPRNAPELAPTTIVTEVGFSTPFDSIETWKATVDQKDLQPWPPYGKLLMVAQ